MHNARETNLPIVFFQVHSDSSFPPPLFSPYFVIVAHSFSMSFIMSQLLPNSLLIAS